MPRTARASVGGICYHVLNRGNARADVFHKDADFIAFLKLIADANERLPMHVLAYCLLNNHFHLVLRPHNDGDLSRWMQWLRNPLRANLVKRAELWPWSSLAWRGSGKRPEILADWPIACPAGWLKRVNRPQSEAEEKALRRAIERGQPFGAESWVEDIAKRLGLESTVRPRGRPRKTEK